MSGGLPNGALYLIEGKAMVDGALCQECEACVAVCPTEAIAIVDQVTAAGTCPCTNDPARA